MTDKPWAELRERLAVASAEAGCCEHPGAENCEQWWQADAALRVFRQYLREISGFLWHSPNGDKMIDPDEIEMVRHGR